MATTMTETERPLASSPLTVAAFFLLIAAGLFLVFDRFVFPISVYWPLRLGYAGFWLLLAGLMLGRNGGKAAAGLLGLFTAVILLSGFVDYDSRKPFLRDLQQVKVSMTVAEVEAIMAGDGRFATVSGVKNDNGQLISGTIAYSHTRAGWGNADVGLVTVADGVVTAVEFSPD